MNELDWTQLIWRHFDREPDTELITGRERRLWDDTRVDVLTNKYACEVDWAYKWAEAVGQAVWYALNTTRQPCIILLVKDKKTDKKHIYRCKTVCTYLSINLYLVDCKRKTIWIDGNESDV
jgi:hypothetical protein